MHSVRSYEVGTAGRGAQFGREETDIHAGILLSSLPHRDFRKGFLVGQAEDAPALPGPALHAARLQGPTRPAHREFQVQPDGRGLNE